MTATARQPNPWLRAGLFFMASILLGGWVAARSETITFDTATFLRFARQWHEADFWVPSSSSLGEATSFRAWLLDHSPALSVVEKQAQHPGFALAVSFVRATGAFFSNVFETPAGWVMVAWGISLIGMGLAVSGVYWFGREWLGEEAGLVGGAISVVSPPFLRIGADGLSDGPAVALMVGSMVFLARALRDKHLSPMVVGCVLAGLGYLFRPEAVQGALVACFLLSCSIVWGVGRQASLRLLLTGAMVLSLFVVPYVFLKGSPLTKKSYLLDPVVYAPAAPAPSVTEPAQASVPVVQNTEPARTEIVPPAAPERAMAESSSSLVSIDQGAGSTEPVAVAVAPEPAPLVRPKYVPAVDLRLGHYFEGVSRYVLLWSSLTAYAFCAPVFVGCLRLTWPMNRISAMVGLIVLANMLLLPIALYCVCGYLDVRHVVPVFLLTAPAGWTGAMFICESIRKSLSWGVQKLRGRAIAWPVSARWATGVVLGVTVLGVGVAAGSFRSNSQMVGLRQMGEWMGRTIKPEVVIVDPSYTSAFYAGMDAHNRWPYVGNLSTENLVDILRAEPDARYVVLSDRQAEESLGAPHWPTDLGDWKLEEVHSLPISSRPDDLDRVRLFQIRQADATAGRQNPSAH